MTTPRIFHHDDPEHLTVFTLLPWYLTGTLSAAERDRVSQHLEQCLTCQRELDDQAVLRGQVADDDVDLSLETSLSHAHKLIDGKEQMQRGTLPVDHKIASGLWPLAIAAMLVIVLAFTLIAPDRSARDAAQSYRTLSNGGPKNGPERFLEIAFSNDSSNTARHELLAAISAEIIRAPVGSDTAVKQVYRVATPAAKQAAIDQTLRANEWVLSVKEIHSP